jgi:hypothetical protein
MSMPTNQELALELCRWRAEASLQLKNLGYVPQRTAHEMNRALAKAASVIAIRNIMEKKS